MKFLFRKNQKTKYSTLSMIVEARASKADDATSGKLVIKAKANKFYRVIPAVVFSPQEANFLLELVDELY